MGEGSLAVGPHKVEGRSLEARAVPALEQFLLFQTGKREEEDGTEDGYRDNKRKHAMLKHIKVSMVTVYSSHND